MARSTRSLAGQAATAARKAISRGSRSGHRRYNRGQEGCPRRPHRQKAAAKKAAPARAAVKKAAPAEGCGQEGRARHGGQL